MTVHYSDESVTLHHGDCLDVLRELPNNSVDSVVCDPPYGLGFMGRDWDRPGSAARGSKTNEALAVNPYSRSRAEYGGASYGGDQAAQMRVFQQWCEQWAAECLRVLKPGGMIAAFGGTRTFHRLACAIEDAGFEIRDSIGYGYTERPGLMAWVTGQGFPKSKNLPGGFGSALKPAWEPIVLARKPLMGTLEANFARHGTGALNIDGCRVQANGERFGGGAKGSSGFVDGYQSGAGFVTSTAGRWPTNVVLDGHAAEELDRQSGTSTSSTARRESGAPHEGNSWAETGGYNAAGRAFYDDGSTRHNDSGGASRFFPTFRYQAKAPTRERPSYVKEGAGTGRVTGLGGKVRQCNVCESRAITSGGTEPSCGHGDFRWEEPTADTGSKVAHPTVKPLELMQWLVRLVTPPGGVCLEPFAGSGTTVEACLPEGFRCIAIEREADYLPLIEARIARQRKPDVPNAAEALALFDFEEPA